VWIKRNSCTYQITSSGAFKNTPRDESQRGMARCGVRFSTGSTTRKKTNGSPVHHLVLCINGQRTQPREWTRVRFVSLCLVQCGLAIRQESPVQLISVPALQYAFIFSALLNTTHICCTTVVTILTTCFHIKKSFILPLCVCVCVCVCVFYDPGINRNNEYFPRQHYPISRFNGNCFLCGTN
jgi:hypothetical protein